MKYTHTTIIMIFESVNKDQGKITDTFRPTSSKLFLKWLQIENIR